MQARSRIMDTDYAAETANLARSQILQQVGIAMLTQANRHHAAFVARATWRSMPLHPFWKPQVYLARRFSGRTGFIDRLPSINVPHGGAWAQRPSANPWRQESP